MAKGKGKPSGNQQKKEGRVGKAIGLSIVVILFSMLAYPLCEWLNYTSEMKDPKKVFYAGIFFCFICGAAFCYLLLRIFPSDLPHFADRIYYYVFCVFSFSAIVDLLIGMTLDGFVQSVDFYLHTGEPYLKSSYGSFINWWDGTFHFALYILMTFFLTLRTGSMSDRIRGMGFIWVGSIMNSLVVFLPGNVVGKFGHELKWSYLLNVPYVLFPLLFARRLFIQPVASPPPSTKKSKSLPMYIVDLALSLLVIAATALAFLRLAGSFNSPALPAKWWVKNVEPCLHSPVLYPALQVIIYATYFVPFYIWALSYLLSTSGAPPSQALWDWANIHFGASLQAQFAFIGPALHNIPTYPEPTFTPVPTHGWKIFVATHALLTVMPFLVWWRLGAARGGKVKSA